MLNEMCFFGKSRFVTLLTEVNGSRTEGKYIIALVLLVFVKGVVKELVQLILFE